MNLMSFLRHLQPGPRNAYGQPVPVTEENPVAGGMIGVNGVAPPSYQPNHGLIEPPSPATLPPSLVNENVMPAARLNNVGMRPPPRTMAQAAEPMPGSPPEPLTTAFDTGIGTFAAGPGNPRMQPGGLRGLLSDPDRNWAALQLLGATMRDIGGSGVTRDTGHVAALTGAMENKRLQDAELQRRIANANTMFPGDNPIAARAREAYVYGSEKDPFTMNAIDAYKRYDLDRGHVSMVQGEDPEYNPIPVTVDKNDMIYGITNTGAIPLAEAPAGKPKWTDIEDAKTRRQLANINQQEADQGDFVDSYTDADGRVVRYDRRSGEEIVGGIAGAGALPGRGGADGYGGDPGGRVGVTMSHTQMLHEANRLAREELAALVPAPEDPEGFLKRQKAVHLAELQAESVKDKKERADALAARRNRGGAAAAPAAAAPAAETRAQQLARYRANAIAAIKRTPPTEHAKIKADLKALGGDTSGM